MNKTRPQRERRKHPRWKQAPEYLPAARIPRVTLPLWWPLIVIPMMVYLNAAPGQTVVDREASTRVSILPERASVQAAAPVQGVNAKGSAYVWERNPKYPVIEFVMMLTEERR